MRVLTEKDLEKYADMMLAGQRVGIVSRESSKEDLKRIASMIKAGQRVELVVEGKNSHIYIERLADEILGQSESEPISVFEDMALRGLENLIFDKYRKQSRRAASKVMTESTLNYTHTDDILSIVMMRGYQRLNNLPDIPEGATEKMLIANQDVDKFLTYFRQEIDREKTSSRYGLQSLLSGTHPMLPVYKSE